MVQSLNKSFILCLLILRYSSAARTTLLRSSSTSTEHELSLQDVLTRLQEIESTTIPSLLENIAQLEEKVSELEHRRLADSCGFVLSEDGSICKLDVPVAFLSDVTIQGTNSKTKILGDLAVEGTTVLKGESTQILSGKVNITGTATIQDLIIGNNFEVFGQSTFDSIEVHQDAIMDHGLTAKGHSHVYDLEVDDELEVEGKTVFEDSVLITGELRVAGDVTIDEKLTVDGETVLQDVIEEGQLVFNNKVVFNDDVEMDKVRVQDLTVDGTCDGCV